jgi:hypothetical protein
LRELSAPGAMNPDSEQVKRERFGELEVVYTNSNTSVDAPVRFYSWFATSSAGLLHMGTGNSLVGQAYRA